MQDKAPLHIIPLDNLQIDSLFETDRDEGFSGSLCSELFDQLGFLLFNNDPKGNIKSAVEGGKEVHLKELQFYCENRKAKIEWMLTFKLNLVSAPSYK